MENKVYQMVTDRIVEQMNKGIIPWRKPWHGGSIVSAEDVAISYVSRRAYSTLNQWLLGEPGEYLTFKQIQDLGGKIRKGEKSKMVVFYTKYEYKTTDEKTGEEKLHCIPVLRYYNVFHINQTEGIKSKVVPGEVVVVESDTDADAVIAAYVERTGLKFQNDRPSAKAYYSPGTDTVVVPMKGQYDHIAEYYSTTFHELTHSTLKADRCDRKAENENAFFGNADYSREELVAEMGSAMLCSHCGVETERTFKNSVAYLQNWLLALKNDPKMIVWASSRAEKAARFILGEPDLAK